MEISKDDKIALLFGIDTIIGEFVLQFLVQSGAYEKIIVFSNKKIDYEGPLIDNQIVDFGNVDSFANLIKGDDLFYCTSSFLQKTTYQVQEGSSTLKNTIPVAKAASLNEVNQFLLLSSLNADPESVIPTNKLRGELEETVKKFPFWATHIFKPAILVGGKPTNRWGEEVANVIGKGLDFLTGGFVSKYQPLEADVVAKAIVSSAQRFKDGLQVYDSEFLKRLAEEFDEDDRSLM